MVEINAEKIVEIDAGILVEINSGKMVEINAGKMVEINAGEWLYHKGEEEAGHPHTSSQSPPTVWPQHSHPQPPHLLSEHNTDNRNITIRIFFQKNFTLSQDGPWPNLQYSQEYFFPNI